MTSGFDRLERELVAAAARSHQRRAVPVSPSGPVRTAAIAILALSPVILIAVAALTLLGHSHKRSNSAPAGRHDDAVVYYHARSVVRPAATSGASFAYEISQIDVWVSGNRRHRISTDVFYTRSGQPLGSPGTLEIATDGRSLQHFQSGPRDPGGEFDVSSAGSLTVPCPAIVACAAAVSVDPASEIPRLLRSGVLRVITQHNDANGHRLIELATQGSGGRVVLFVHPGTFVPTSISEQFGMRPWPAFPSESITITRYRRLPRTPKTKPLLDMRPHPGARQLCGGHGSGGLLRPAVSGTCNPAP